MPNLGYFFLKMAFSIRFEKRDQTFYTVQTNMDILHVKSDIFTTNDIVKINFVVFNKSLQYRDLIEQFLLRKMWHYDRIHLTIVQKPDSPHNLIFKWVFL
jgi:hypothetical protein